ncbi:MAG: sensor histidine kinase [bacterium]
MKHPVLQSRRNVVLYYLTWMVVAGGHILVLVINGTLAWQWALLDGLLFNAVYATLALSFWYASKYVTLDRSRWLKVAENHLFASLFTSALWLGVSYFGIVSLFGPPEAYVEFLDLSLIWRGLLGTLFYFLVTSFYYVYIFSENYKTQLIKEARLETLVKEAELRSLKFQINPHFIFNSLNSINALTLTNPEKAGEMTVKLGEYLRYTLSRNEKQRSTLQEEIDSIKLYLDIEKVRFGNKLGYCENVEPSCLDKEVPSMIFQPLIENAIKHGVYESLEPVNIRFDCVLNGDYLKVTVENNYDPEAITFKGEGIGLHNVRNRLEMMYDHVNLLDIDREKNLFRVRIFIPVTESAS